MTDADSQAPKPGSPEPPLHGPATIHDVARRAGVSTSTVSRSLSGEPRVSAQTRERIRLIAEEIGYRPSRSAQALRLARTGTIGFLAPNLENPISYDHLRATVRAAHEVGYTVLVGDSQDSPEIQDAEIARMRDYRVDGLIIGRGLVPVTRSLFQLVDSAIPVEPYFTAGDLKVEPGGRVNVYRHITSDAVGATIAFRRLARLGHQRFAIFLFAHAASATGRARHQRLREVLDSEDRRSASVVEVRVADPDECVPELHRLMASPDSPTAIISANGRLTPYILEGIHSAGLEMPGDVSFMSFGDSQWHRAYSPPISVVRQDYAAVAKSLVQRLVQRVAGAIPEPGEVRESEFVMRGSMGQAPRSVLRSVTPERTRRARRGSSDAG
ncbi:MAG: LacI family DNA-binding transcriptional regulator [Dehalococcoidia bacterium]|jgi:LacI family transcriptional regulator|uniref:LacI family DNA-binding transcriptional regulator n=1 Tax=Candidatus Amarobacter glycogenicus TaxID=3140699 RepID=UPI0031356A3D|nr:LacI family DNA-binding transcriptional regulator [Dehalococcoidia bacterium]MBK6562087.1 LacI family DNA-binding transcriptional regulator [Dehalococcoidia bacterium]MBK7124716.1 LacI family DNA-binding transcriptional regulator [Dehalococcoidia bacterium]MBK7327927.1 LacI family DNA-binding transcriptional regulator [Dehalococcoidia bacterium]MBK8561155.1 LacI family DNA-binding transcriptional regulator [Dehalococcoidia bacterium]